MPDIGNDAKGPRPRDEELVLAAIERATPQGGISSQSISRMALISIDRVHDAVFELRRRKTVMIRSGLWRVRPRPKMLVPELGLEDTQRNRRWLAIVALFARHSTQEEAQVLAWEVVKTWEETK